jgi:hypothetical protein
MRITHFILAFGVILFAPSLAGPTEGVRGAGTFSYNGAPVGINLPEAIIVAGLTRAIRS